MMILRFATHVRSSLLDLMNIGTHSRRVILERKDEVGNLNGIPLPGEQLTKSPSLNSVDRAPSVPNPQTIKTSFQGEIERWLTLNEIRYFLDNDCW